MLIGCIGANGATPVPAAPETPNEKTSSESATAMAPASLGSPHRRPSDAVTSPTKVAALPTEPIVLGYYTNWAHKRTQPCAFQTSDVNASLFTHINFAFAGISVSDDQEDYALVPTSAEDARLYREVNALKEKNPALKTMLSVGGWAFNDPPTAWVFSAMVETPERRGRFIRQSVRFLRENGFDGLDIDWEFPGAADRGGGPQDRENFTALLREFRAHMSDEAAESGKAELLLTIAAPAGPNYAAGLELEKIHEPLDWINVMTYDYHGEWEMVTGANAPLTGDGLSIAGTLSAYRAAGIPAKKFVLGFATYARGWSGVEKAALGANGSGKAPPGPCGADSFSAHQVEALVKAGVYQGKWDAASQTPFAYDPKAKVLLTYDSARSYEEKLRFLKKEGLGGAMFWAIDLDDVQGGYPLMTQVSKSLRPVRP